MRFRLLAFVALVLGMVSCQQDFEFVNGVGDEVNFQLSVSAEELATRAGEDGSADDQSAADSAYGAIDYLQGVAANDAMRLDWSEVNLRYTLEVYNYNANGDYSQPVLVKDRQVIIVDEYAPATFDMRLIANRQYHFVVFADFVPQSVTNDTQNKSYEAQAELGLHHTIGTTLAEITVKNDAINNEATDAYFVATDITVANTSAYNVILKRPYGKLRVVATDLAELNLNVDPAKVVVSYDAAHPTKFNAITGSIDFEQSTVTTSFTSEYNATIGKNSLADHFYTAGYDDQSLYYTVNDNGVVRNTHMTLFTDYILAEEDQDGVHFTMTTYDGDGAVIKEVEFATEIPVQRNYLTTIVGNVLTTATQVEVMINDNFDGEIPVGYYENNEIHYTATSKVTPKYPDSFGGATIIANEWDANTGEGIITFNRDITEIGSSAFYYCTNLTSVTIPNKVRTIGWNTFANCHNLREVTIPNSVTTLSVGAFDNCSSLTTIKIPNSVRSIGSYAFRGCTNLEKFEGDLASNDGRYLILNNELKAFAPAGLTEYSIPDSVTKIGDTAFYSCNNLTSVTIPASLTSVGSYAFADCKNLSEFKGSHLSADNRCIIINGTLYAFARAGLTEYSIPNGVTKVGDTVFYYCSNLTKVTIPNGVVTIGGSAFQGCSNFTEITIPNSVKTIGEYAFQHCSKVTTLNIPDSVTSLGYGAFSYCTSLSDITIGSGLTSVNVNPFFLSHNFSEFKGNFVSADGRCLIHNNTLYSFACKGVTEYVIPDGVKIINTFAFWQCRSLTKVTIPASVTSIGYASFNGCSQLKEVYCLATTPPTGGNEEMFDNNAAGRKIYVPRGSGAAYKAARYWSDYAADIVEYDF